MDSTKLGVPCCVDPTEGSAVGELLHHTGNLTTSLFSCSSSLNCQFILNNILIELAAETAETALDISAAAVCFWSTGS
jgi:hypothetical protein